MDNNFVFGNTLAKHLALISLCTVILCAGCSKTENKKYIAEKVTEMYVGVSRNPMADMITKMNEAISSGNITAAINEQKNELDYAQSEFNANCAEKILQDPILTEYFTAFCKRHSSQETLSIDKLNYYGISLRSSLEKELGVDILD